MWRRLPDDTASRCHAASITDAGTGGRPTRRHERPRQLGDVLLSQAATDLVSQPRRLLGLVLRLVSGICRTLLRDACPGLAVCANHGLGITAVDRDIGRDQDIF